jgi:hypothetical protein
MIIASVKYTGLATNGRRGTGPQFTVSITDVTQGETYNTSSVVPSALQTSAEWIAEAPCCERNGSILPLADFGTALFSNGLATVSNTTGSIGSFGANVQSLTMVGEAAPATIKAQPSALSGGNFSVAWMNPGP